MDADGGVWAGFGRGLSLSRPPLASGFRFEFEDLVQRQANHSIGRVPGELVNPAETEDGEGSRRPADDAARFLAVFAAENVELNAERTTNTLSTIFSTVAHLHSTVVGTPACKPLRLLSKGVPCTQCSR